MARLKLFDEDGDTPGDDLSKIEINREFAKRYEHNKKREELQRYEELKKQGRVDASSSDSEGSSSEEDEELIKPSKRTDVEFFDALIKVKNQDPILRNKDAKLFNSDSDNEDDGNNASEENGNKEKKKKPMYLKDVVSKHLIEAGPEFDDQAMENENNDEMGDKVKSYSEEQDELRREFLKAVEEEDKEEGDLLRVKNSEGKEEEDEEEEEIGGKLDEYFGEDGKLDEDMMFLKDYFRNRMWIDDEKSKHRGDEEIEFSEDEEEIERQEDYEREYNFRFEENAGDRVMGHSRKIEGSVRKKENARKSQRERKEERMAQAEFERKEELKRLKNLKKKEINEKLEKIREVAGIGKDGGGFLDEDDLEEDFDPEEYDRKMNEAFGDGYYEAEDVDPEFGSDRMKMRLGLRNQTLIRKMSCLDFQRVGMR
ncbi:UNVERIFIED_CONTAM: protein kri1 [Sesamum radiatum]|uniref:Protein kri1 n=1 Tax=Sesamum radiatum TaxID=300843 RepID=A0AAW2PXI8_SESRA